METIYDNQEEIEDNISHSPDVKKITKKKIFRNTNKYIQQVEKEFHPKRDTE